MTSHQNIKNKLDTHLEAYNGDNLYDFDNTILLEWYPKRVLKHCQNANSLLELGLGHGFTTNIFSQNFERHVVLDGSPAVINNFKANYPKCEAEIVEIFFEDYSATEKFDVIVMGFILEHVDDPKQILKHFKKFLAPGGKLFVSVPNAEVLNRRLGHLAGMLPDIEALSEHDHLLGHQRYYTVDTLTNDIEQSGYVVTNYEGIYLKPFTTSQIISLNFDDKIIQALCLAGIDYPELSCGILAELTLSDKVSS